VLLLISAVPPTTATAPAAVSKLGVAARHQDGADAVIRRRILAGNDRSGQAVMNGGVLVT